MALMEHSAHCCNRLGKLAEAQHTSRMSQPQTGTVESKTRGERERERDRVVWEKTKKNHWSCWQGIIELC